MPTSAVVGPNADKYCTENKDCLYFVDRDVFCYKTLCMELGHSRISANSSSLPPPFPLLTASLPPCLFFESRAKSQE